MADPDLDVLIATLGRPDRAADVVRDVVDQGAGVGAIVVVDQSGDRDRAVLADRLAALADPRIRHVPAPAEGLPAARNRALSAASAPGVVFFDDDVRLLPGCLAAHRAALARRGIGAVAGRIVERISPRNSRRVRNRVAIGGRVVTHLAGSRPRRVRSVKGANMAFRRDVLVAAGGFDRRYRGTAFLEEADACARIRRLGWTVWFAPRAEVIHLSAPAGGVRQPDPRGAERWRFHNTGVYVRTHRGGAGMLPVSVTFAAVALRRAIQWRDPAAAPALMGALFDGCRAGGRPPRLLGDG